MSTRSEAKRTLQRLEDDSGALTNELASAHRTGLPRAHLEELEHKLAAARQAADDAAEPGGIEHAERQEEAREKQKGRTAERQTRR
ncbi:hypothetical protein [Deinococcus alpinitundrae]|uniref:hypothetical protein n=1 Tax=Deinococcus alpinitundrae TaxID=468913 RepID=UPI00137A8D6E|nr:hypothetical protein [Deinococcus alpinitundrae]